MKRDKLVQILFHTTELDNIKTAAANAGIKLSHQGRYLLTTWADHQLGKPGGARGATCGKAKCGNTPAVWYHTELKSFYCEACGIEVNRSRGYKICVQDGGPDPSLFMTAEPEPEELPARQKTREELVREMIKHSKLLYKATRALEEMTGTGLPSQLADMIAKARDVG